ncbi:MAG: hypothetical protein DCC65_16970 [Planctomycetota bacterium]|nr:MAG: hypothetical protein DCC65_16970 [Planctomycetota bacterium]
MAVELECKLAVADHESVRERLRASGAVRLCCVLERNRLFDDERKSLLAAGCGLRVRDIRVLDGDPAAAPATLTFKGPVLPGPFKRREEIEMPIGDADAMARLLEALGYRPWIAFEKRRESWRLPGDVPGAEAAGDSRAAEPAASGGCVVELDELPRLGCFVEVEGPTHDAIRRALFALGLDPAGCIRQGYPALVAECAGGDGPFALTFPPGS